MQGDNVFCSGQKILTKEGQDGWYRTFRGYPDMNQGIKDMLRGYADEGKYSSILIFFVNKCNFGVEYSSFLMREFGRGFI